MDHLADDFWHIRGDFRVAQIVNIGTQMSLVRRPGHSFLLLDSYEASEKDQYDLLALTDGGLQIEAVLNLHPFHTVHCAFVQQWLPHARLIGTRRHHVVLPELRWDPALIEDAATQRRFADTLDFSIPLGVDFISNDEDVHVGSVIARHCASAIVHSDDTLNILDLPSLVEKLLPDQLIGPKLRFHPELAKALEKRSGAADDYVRWAKQLAHDWADTQIVCAAHNGIARMTDQSFGIAIEKALKAASDALDTHREAYG